MCKLGFGEQVPKPKTCKYQVSGDKKTDIGLVWLWTGCMTRCPYKGQLKFNSPDERSSRRIKNRRNRGRQKEQQEDQKREKQIETKAAAGSTGETGRTGEKQSRMDSAGAWWQIVCWWGLHRERIWEIRFEEFEKYTFKNLRNTPAEGNIWEIQFWGSRRGLPCRGSSKPSWMASREHLINTLEKCTLRMRETQHRGRGRNCGELERGLAGSAGWEPVLDGIDRRCRRCFASNGRRQWEPPVEEPSTRDPPQYPQLSLSDNIPRNPLKTCRVLWGGVCMQWSDILWGGIWGAEHDEVFGEGVRGLSWEEDGGFGFFSAGNWDSADGSDALAGKPLSLMEGRIGQIR